SERRARFGHRAALVAFAVPAEHTTELAYRLEEELFARGGAGTVIDVLALQDGTRSPALLADVGEQCLRAGRVASRAGAGRRRAPPPGGSREPGLAGRRGGAVPGRRADGRPLRPRPPPRRSPPAPTPGGRPHHHPPGRRDRGGGARAPDGTWCFGVRGRGRR